MFMSQPRAVETRRKYRDVADMEEELGATANMMFDPRVIRGVTCARPDDGNPLAATHPMSTQKMAPPIKRSSKAHLIRTGKIRPPQKPVSEIHDNIVVPKKRVEVPLHLYLLEQSEQTQMHDEDTQTDAFLKEEETPEFIPRKSGVDVETQVENEEVFDYDRDVLPILEVVISKSVEQSIMEVRQEEELRWIAFKKDMFAEKARKRDKEAEEREKEEQGKLKHKEQTVVENRSRAAREKRLQQKLAANVFAGRYTKGLQASVFKELERCNFFYDPMEMHAESMVPWLKTKITENSEEVAEQKRWLDDILAAAVLKITTESEEAHEARRIQREKEEKEAAERAIAEAEASRRAKVLKLTLSAPFLEEGPVKLKLRADSSVEQVQQKVVEWLTNNMGDAMPKPERLKFLLAGHSLDPTSILCDMPGDLSQLQMVLEAEAEAEEGDAAEGDDEEN